MEFIREKWSRCGYRQKISAKSFGPPENGQGYKIALGLLKSKLRF
jgi:hypothetical protein